MKHTIKVFPADPRHPDVNTYTLQPHARLEDDICLLAELRYSLNPKDRLQAVLLKPEDFREIYLCLNAKVENLWFALGFVINTSTGPIVVALDQSDA